MPSTPSNPSKSPGTRPLKTNIADAPELQGNKGIPQEEHGLTGNLSQAPELLGASGAPAGTEGYGSTPAVREDSPPSRTTGAYSNAGTLTAAQIINGDADKYSWLDPLIVEVTGWVQQTLVAADRAEDIGKARTDHQKRVEIAAEIDRLALSYMVKERKVRGDEGKMVVAQVVNEIIGLGPLEPLWQDPTITEVIVNGPNSVYVEQKGKLVKAKACRFRSSEHLLDVCQRILSPLNRKVDVRDPLADGRLPDGSRVNVVHQSIAPKGPLLTIRRFPEKNISLVDLVNMNSLNKEMATLLATLVRTKNTCLVVGGTGTGKTTLLNAMTAAIPLNERIVTIEDSLELRPNKENHVAAMEARPADPTGANMVTIRDLVRNSLRMRPDRIIVGEIRDAAALDMLQACNTGHEGSMSTVHANGPNEAISRLTVMVAQGGDIPAEKVDWLVGSAIDIVVMIKKYEDGSRRISGLYEVPSVDTIKNGERLMTIPLWEWKETGMLADGTVVGEYTKLGELSEQLMKQKALDVAKPVTWDELMVMCGAHVEEVPVIKRPMMRGGS